MTRSFLISLVLTGVVAVAALSFFYFDGGVRLDPGLETEEVFEEAVEPLYAPTDPVIEIRLFFPGRNNDVLLRTRNVMIFASVELENRIRQIVEKLILGGDDTDLFGSLPPDTRLNEVFLADQGVVYLDFSSAISDNHPGGVLPEQATIFSIVNSLTYNLEAIDRVKILVGGTEKETLAGHCLLTLPLEMDLSISDMGLNGGIPTASLIEPSAGSVAGGTADSAAGGVVEKSEGFDDAN